MFVKRYGEEELLNCLERNDKNGVVYHRDGINGDYDDFDDVEAIDPLYQRRKEIDLYKTLTIGERN